MSNKENTNKIYLDDDGLHLVQGENRTTLCSVDDDEVKHIRDCAATFHCTDVRAEQIVKSFEEEAADYADSPVDILELASKTLAELALLYQKTALALHIEYYKSPSLFAGKANRLFLEKQHQFFRKHVFPALRSVLNVNVILRQRGSNHPMSFFAAEMYPRLQDMISSITEPSCGQYLFVLHPQEFSERKSKARKKKERYRFYEAAVSTKNENPIRVPINDIEDAAHKWTLYQAQLRNKRDVNSDVVWRKVKEQPDFIKCRKRKGSSSVVFVNVLMGAFHLNAGIYVAPYTYSKRDSLDKKSVEETMLPLESVNIVANAAPLPPWFGVAAVHPSLNNNFRYFFNGCDRSIIDSERLESRLRYHRERLHMDNNDPKRNPSRSYSSYDTQSRDYIPTILRTTPLQAEVQNGKLKLLKKR